MKLPLILKDKENNILRHHITVDEPTFFIKSYKKFAISILDITEFIDNYDDPNNIDIGDLMNGFGGLEESDIIRDKDRLQEIFDTDKPLIYSVVMNDVNNIKDTTIVKGTSFTDVNTNYSYTLYFGEYVKTLCLICYDIENGENIFIQINYRPFDKLTEDEKHYQDYIDNYSLPNLNELSTIIFDKQSRYTMLRKLLLDFRNIKVHRGKLKSIEKFLNYLGFDPDTIKLYPEYITPNKSKTIKPNKLVDVKTGYYHLIFDNYDIDSDKRYEPDNLPYIKSQFKDVDDLFERLLKALSIAHKYFTVDEQELSFFGINNMFNVRRYLSVGTNMTTTHYIDTLRFRKDIEIDIYNQTAIHSNHNYFVKKNNQVSIEAKKTEVKYYIENPKLQINNQIFKVDREIIDEEHKTNLSTEEQLKIRYDFGNIVNINIDSKNSDIEYTIVNLDNELIQYKSERKHITNNQLNDKIFLRPKGTYEIRIFVYDGYGAREEFRYKIELKNVHIDFDLFNSGKIIYDKSELNSVWNGGFLTQDIDSTHFIQNRNDTGNNKYNQKINDNNYTIDNYFEQIIANRDTKEYDNLYGFEQYRLPRLNMNNSVSKLTETLTTEFIDNFQHIITVNGTDIDNIECDDSIICRSIIIKDSYEHNATETLFYLITPKESGIDINEQLHSIIINTLSGDTYDTWQLTNNLLPKEFELKSFYLPLNYDISIDNTNLNSVFPRLNHNLDTDILRLGDIIVCRINNRFITNAKDFNWKLINSSTQKVVAESNEFSLKHRIINNEIYDIELSVNIDGDLYVIRKNNIITSFEI